jgi:hypothetical protein
VRERVDFYPAVLREQILKRLLLFLFIATAISISTASATATAVRIVVWIIGLLFLLRRQKYVSVFVNEQNLPNANNLTSGKRSVR